MLDLHKFLARYRFLGRVLPLLVFALVAPLPILSSASPYLPDDTSVSNVGLHIDPATVEIEHGSLAMVAVMITEVEDLGSFEFELGYDPAVVSVEGVELGALPESTGRGFTEVGPTIDEGAGRVTYGAYSMGSTPEGATGDGVLAVVALRADGEGTTTVAFSDAQVSDVSGVAQPIGAQAGGEVTVTAGCAAPGRPTLESPADGAAVETGRPGLAWGEGANCEEYQVQVAADGNFTNVEVEATTSEREYVLGEALGEGRWHWRVRGGNECGTAGSWSAVRTFTVASATSVDLYVAPAAARVAAGEALTVSVGVTGVEDLGSFEFELGYDPAVVSVEGVELGALPESTGRGFTEVGPTIDEGAGRVTYGAYSMGSKAGGATGDGVLAVVSLQALGVGVGELTFEGAQVTDVSGEGQVIEHLNSGQIFVVEKNYVYLPAILLSHPVP